MRWFNWCNIYEVVFWHFKSYLICNSTSTYLVCFVLLFVFLCVNTHILYMPMRTTGLFQLSCLYLTQGGWSVIIILISLRCHTSTESCSCLVPAGSFQPPRTVWKITGRTDGGDLTSKDAVQEFLFALICITMHYPMSGIWLDIVWGQRLDCETYGWVTPEGFTTMCSEMISYVR